MLIAVFDIGGTSIKFGIANEDGDLLFHDAFPSEAYLGGEAIMNKVISQCKQFKKKWDIGGITISTAGQIDAKNGVVVYATENIPGYTGVEISKYIGSATGLPVKAENDVNCTALGEHWKGAAKNVDNFLCVSLGTGIGGAIFINGQLYTGHSFSAGEIGHINLYPGGKLCTCGNYGCFEKYASSLALEEMIKEKFNGELGMIEFFDRLRSGDHEGKELLNQWIDHLTTGLQSLVHMFNPEMIVIGGGISAQGDFLLKLIKESLFKKIMPNHKRNLSVKMAVHDNKANLLGAIKHFIVE